MINEVHPMFAKVFLFKDFVGDKNSSFDAQRHQDGNPKNLHDK